MVAAIARGVKGNLKSPSYTSAPGRFSVVVSGGFFGHMSFQSILVKICTSYL
jgi:hypothetical protein